MAVQRGRNMIARVGRDWKRICMVKADDLGMIVDLR